MVSECGYKFEVINVVQGCGQLIVFLIMKFYYFLDELSVGDERGSKDGDSIDENDGKLRKM